jgi:FHS family Na+ dependent glucose MFS transporter 1
MVSEAIGPCLPSLAERLAVQSPAELAPGLIGRGLGYSIGTLAMGAFLEKKQRRWSHPALAVCSLLMGAINLFVPWANSVALLVCLLTARGLATGALDVGANILLVHLWAGDEKGSSSAMNALQFSWGMGAFFAPVFVHNVGLAPSQLPHTFFLLSITGGLMGLGPAFFESPVEAENVKTELTELNGQVSTEQADGPGAGKGCRFYLIFITLFSYYFCYAGGEMTPGDWMTTAATQQLGVPVASGVMITSVFWCFLTAGRLLAVPLGLCMSSNMLTALSLAVAAAGALLLVFSFGRVWLTGVYISAASIGIGLAPLYPAGIILAQSKFRMSSTWISRFIAGSTVGMMLMPAIVGTLLHYSPHVFSWAVVFFVSVQAGSFCLLLALSSDSPKNEGVALAPEQAGLAETGPASGYQSI